MLRLFSITIACHFLVFCSSGLKNDRISSFVKDTGSDEVSIEDESDEEEITAIPPTVISGSYLACHPQGKNEETGSVFISCHLEKDGKILDEIELLESDIVIYDDNGDQLELSFSVNKFGVLLIKVKLLDTSNINISLERVGGAEIAETEESDTESLKSVITIEEISQTEEVAEEAVEQSQTQQGSEQTNDESAEESSSNQTEASEEELANEETITEVLDCDALGSPGSWIFVPGDTEYETSDFCVMKYEAKCSLEDGSACTDLKANESPRSIPSNTPWVSINQQDAKDECASLGDGFRLITNDQWMTIAANAAGVQSNWSNGVVGDVQLKRGHSDNNPAQACAASADDSLNVVETDCSNQASSNDSFIEQRTLALSNGKVLWDLSGNVWEWTDYFNDQDKPTPLGNQWLEYTEVVGSETMPLFKLIPQFAIDNSWNASNGLGRYFPGEQGSGGFLRRGGFRSSASAAGIFTAYLDGSSTYTSTNAGFRCTFAVP